MTTEVDSLEAKRKVTQSLNLIILRSEERVSDEISVSSQDIHIYICFYQIIPYMEIIANEIPAMCEINCFEDLYKVLILRI